MNRTEVKDGLKYGMDETHFICNLFPLENTSGNTTTRWKNILKTAKFHNLQNLNNSTFLLGISGVNFLNTIYNVYSNNDQFVFYEIQTPGTFYKRTLIIPHKKYTLTTLATQLQTLINTGKNADGTYAVTIDSNGYFVITYTPSVQTWAFQLELPNVRTANQQYCYELFGFQQNSEMTGFFYLNASDLPNLNGSITNLFICCDAVRYNFYYADNPATKLQRCLLAVPFNYVSSDLIVYDPKDIIWQQSEGGPFYKQMEWSILDEDGVEIEGLQRLAFDLHVIFYTDNTINNF